MIRDARWACRHLNNWVEGILLSKVTVESAATIWSATYRSGLTLSSENGDQSSAVFSRLIMTRWIGNDRFGCNVLQPKQLVGLTFDW